MSGRSTLVDLVGCRLIRETEKARLIDYDGKEAWLPKSAHEWEPAGRFGTVTLEQSLAEEKELV